MNALLDLNAMLDLFLLPHPWLAEAGAIWEANRNGGLPLCGVDTHTL